MEKRPYEAPRLTSEKVFIPMLNAATSTLAGYGAFKRPPPKH